MSPSKKEWFSVHSDHPKWNWVKLPYGTKEMTQKLPKPVQRIVLDHEQKRRKNPQKHDKGITFIWKSEEKKINQSKKLVHCALRPS